MVSRRRLLQASVAGLVATTVGCTSLSQSETSTEIGEVRAENHLSKPVDVQLQLTDGSDPVYWQSQTLPAATDDDHTTREFTDLPTKPARYTLHTRTRAYSEDDWETVDLSDAATSCKAFILEVGQREDAGADSIGILSSSNENHCEEDGWN